MTDFYGATIETRPQLPKVPPREGGRAEMIWEERIFWQSNEVSPEDGVPLETHVMNCPFFNTQTKRSIERELDLWTKDGYHVVDYRLLEIKARYEGERFFTVLWRDEGLDEDEF